MPIVKIVIEAGASQGLFDFAGWATKEHTVFRRPSRGGKISCPINHPRKSGSSQIFFYLGPTRYLRSLPFKYCTKTPWLQKLTNENEK